ncbi:HAMP domain-containing sensor histidine kinase [Xanthomarina sp. F1114]|uniref:sensor histidine kinase n=1 Tax=Xanthomarina sp. F1114 TaxID=2996019 RepID=UPI00225DE7BC|nr:HAMP domain-containing sensor histidine kinase [Xanthomarina sp. F1114]MCX7547031.1 HAMP domain-containing sensor histidine kinase [Xanthomarina sp. F1114]
MLFSKHRNLSRWIIVVASFGIISLILWNTYVFFQEFKIEEQSKMDIWAAAHQEINSNPLDENVNPLVDKVFTSDISNPMFVYNKGNVLLSNNIEDQKLKSDKSIKKLIKQYSEENTPIVISYEDSETKETVVYGTLYYGNSEVLNKLKYYPLALLLIIFLFGAVAYFFYRSSKIAAQNKLWSGMAKETAHQIGTPLSSLIGWAEILKTENINPEYIVEIEKDISRLQTITERFSKIGSLPTLEKTDIVKETIDSYDYLKARSSKLIEFKLITVSNEIYVNLNKQLYSWTIENLVKNAIDAMKGKGQLTIEILQLENTVKINVSDTGNGLPKKQFNAIFEPGYTTKKRGWGLGLSLAKRIIEEFHDGKIKVLHSEIGKGTTMQISMKSV